MRSLLLPKNRGTQATLLLFVIIAALPWFVKGQYWQGVLIVSLYYAILAVAFNLLAGYGGQFSLAPAAFSVLGAYTTGVLNFHFGVAPLWGILAAVIVTYVIGYGLGRLVLRMSGHYLALTTFAFLNIVVLVIANSYSVTRGDLGLTVTGFSGFSRVGYFYLFLGALLLVHLITTFIMRSRAGLFVRALRDDETAAVARGVDVVRWKIILFSVSSAMSGFAGALYVHFIRLASPEIGTILESGLIISMVVIGGMGTMLGPILGAFLVTIGAEALREVGVQHMLVFSVLMILVVRFFYGGIIGTISELFRPRRTRRASESAGGRGT